MKIGFISAEPSYAQTEAQIQTFIENAIEEDRKNPDLATAIVTLNIPFGGTT